MDRCKRWSKRLPTDEFVGKRIQPFWIEDEAKKITGSNFIVSGRFKAHASEMELSLPDSNSTRRRCGSTRD
jgi:hypothetical protein